MTVISASEARAALPELLNRVEAGEVVTITRHGRPVAVLVYPELFHRRRPPRALADAERVHTLLAAARTTPRPAGGLTAGRAEELVAEIRAGREAR